MGTPRRVGAETSRSRDALLDCVEQLMLEKGYAGVTYRAVAAQAEVSAGLVQYYFPKLDDLFIAAIRRRSDENLERLRQALSDPGGDPLRVLWEYSKEEATAALTTEFIALGNHRKSIQAVIAEVTEQVRHVQLQAVRGRVGRTQLGHSELSEGALLFLVTGIPKLIRLEQGVGVTVIHDEVVRAFEAFLGAEHPREDQPRRRATRRSASA